MTRPLAFPLTWPHGHPRARKSAPCQFRTQLNGALKNVRKSLEDFGRDSKKPIKDVIISSNVTLGVDSPADSGVAVYFNWDGDNVCIPVDRYAKTQDNLQAIHHIIEARRTELRHGGIHIVKATFAGFKALPAPRGHKDWRRVLGFEGNTHPAKSDILALHKDLLRNHHPDNGGDTETMAAINAARDEALAELGH